MNREFWELLQRQALKTYEVDGRYLCKWCGHSWKLEHGRDFEQHLRGCSNRVRAVAR